MTEKKLGLSPQEERSLEAKLHGKYAAYLGMRSFRCSSSHDTQHCQVEILLESPDKSVHYPVQGGMDFQSQKLTAREAQLFLMDYLEQYFESYFLEDEKLFLAIQWKAYSLEGYTFYLRGQILNLKLEEAAQELLKEEPPAKN